MYSCKCARGGAHMQVLICPQIHGLCRRVGGAMITSCAGSNDNVGLPIPAAVSLPDS